MTPIEPESPLDYPAEDYVHAETPRQLKALGSELRLSILTLLNDRAASITELATALGRPKGTVGYHMKVLEAAGLVRVVRTRRVRAMTEKFYGRVARTVVMHGLPDPSDPLFMLRRAIAEAVVDEDQGLPAFTLRHVRIGQGVAAEFWERLAMLAEEFAAQPRSGSQVYAMLAGVYPTNRPILPEANAE